MNHWPKTVSVPLLDIYTCLVATGTFEFITTVQRGVLRKYQTEYDNKFTLLDLYSVLSKQGKLISRFSSAVIRNWILIDL